MRLTSPASPGQMIVNLLGAYEHLAPGLCYGGVHKAMLKLYDRQGVCTMYSMFTVLLANAPMLKSRCRAAASCSFPAVAVYAL